LPAPAIVLQALRVPIENRASSSTAIKRFIESLLVDQPGTTLRAVAA
jgi:hypothetical protein